MVNEEFDKVTTLTARIIEGTIPKSETLQVTYLGLREEFVLEGDEEGFVDANGEIFGVLKEM